jgi:hypothetical protein
VVERAEYRRNMQRAEGFYNTVIGNWDSVVKSILRVFPAKMMTLHIGVWHEKINLSFVPAVD